jgi:hypothetical protein
MQPVCEAEYSPPTKCEGQEYMELNIHSYMHFHGIHITKADMCLHVVNILMNYNRTICIGTTISSMK